MTNIILPDKALGFSLEKATNAVLDLKQNVGKGIIALGQWIEIAKDSLPKTEWLSWLKYDVKIHPVTAYRYIRIAKQIDYQTLEKLGTAKVWELLELPQSKFTEEFIEKASHMTRLELRKEVQKVQDEVARVEKGEVVEGESDYPELPPVADNALRKNIEFLEQLQEIDLESIPANYLGLIRNQLNVNLKTVSSFLSELSNVSV